MTRSWPARALTSPLAVPVCLLVAFAVLGSVWALGRPYGVTTDEEAHYVRALGLSTGDVTGEASVWPDRAFTPEQQRTLDAATRRFRMPERVAPRRNPTGGSIFSCFAFQPTRPASCITDPSGPVLQETYVGVYPPLPYLLPGVVARGAGDPVWGLLLARLGSGVLCLVVLALCVWGVRDPDAPALSLLGVTVALTPTVMFFAWSMNAGGLEMASGIAFVALCLRLARPQRPPSWMWGATAVSGLLLGGSRPIALVWVFFGLWVAALVHGPRALVERAKGAGRPAAVMVVVLVATVVIAIVWNLLLGVRAPGGDVAWSQLVQPALGKTRLFLHEQIGLFGWAEFYLPKRLIRAWEVLLLALAALALAVGTWRQRLAPILLFVTYVAGNVALTRMSQAGGFPMAGRYLQPAATAFPLVLGEVIYSNRERLAGWLRRWLVLASVSLVAFTQAWALLLNGRRYAVGVEGPWSYLFGGARWSPPGGWLLWAVLTVAGVSLLWLGFACAPVDRAAINPSSQGRRAPDRRPRPWPAASYLPQ